MESTWSTEQGEKLKLRGAGGGGKGVGAQLLVWLLIPVRLGLAGPQGPPGPTVQGRAYQKGKPLEAATWPQ